MSDRECAHDFGSPDSSLVFCGCAPSSRAALESIRSFIETETPPRLLLQAPSGCGKTQSAGIVLARMSSIRILRVREASDVGTVARSLGKESSGLVLVDDLDRLSASAQEGLVGLVLDFGARAFLTATSLRGSVLFMLEDDENCEVVTIESLEGRDGDVHCLVEVFWGELNASRLALEEVLDSEAAEELCLGPWARGGHDLKSVIESVSDLLELEGCKPEPSGSPSRLLRRADVRGAMLDLLRSESQVNQSISPERIARIYVEGETDLILLDCAAKAALEHWDVDLLRGVEIVPAGPARSGGATRVLRRVIADSETGPKAIGLLDNDSEGRQQAATAKRFEADVLKIPVFLDPLNRDSSDERLEVEIEDVLPVALVEQFYLEHSDLEPEAEIRMGTNRRIKVDGVDKERFANWVAHNAELADLMGLIYLLCSLVHKLGLPLPPGGPSLDDVHSELLRSRGGSP